MEKSTTIVIRDSHVTINLGSTDIESLVNQIAEHPKLQDTILSKLDELIGTITDVADNEIPNEVAYDPSEYTDERGLC